ncbi:MAG: single-stranded-DNA-specific exonuclease RecJ [Spirochaetaceae bacterium]|jgi:single-stranded-DNA-specific exonuclease|nr:single-stranded-DNA-specific exonuclease RecJ [Spirochaetaceae bacterium]
MMKWNKKDAPPDLVKEIAAKYACDLCTASILIRRGVTSAEDLLFYLEGDKRYLRNPFELSGMEDAVERILAAIEEGEKILIFGDRDSDGVTSLTIVTHFLRSVCPGKDDDVFWKLPEYDEPYGLSMEAVEFAAAQSVSLIITVDCGISNFEEIRRANDLQIDVIVTDHHKPQEKLPEAYAIIDPKLTKEGEEPYPFQDLAGCGVAYKLVSALRFAQKSSFYNQPLCLFNAAPANDDSYLIEIIKTRNLTVIDRLSEVIVPGAVKIAGTRLPRFLEGQQICVFDEAAQKKLCEKIFGRSVEFAMLDLAPLIACEIPQTRGKSLLRLKDISRIALYTSKPLSEADVLFNLFVSFAHKKEKLSSPDDDDDLQLAAIGTIADLMPLQDENRIIVKAGISALLRKPRAGISDLLYKFNLNAPKLSSTDISWQLTPVINSAGRLGEAGTPVKLLLASDKIERDKLVNRIKGLNDQRRELADKTWELVQPRAEEQKNRFNGNLAFASGDDIKRGVTGVMANRLTNKYKVPSLILSYNNDVATGSMRSVRGYDLQGVLEMGRDLFIDSGGHNYAVGFSLQKENVDEFLSRLKTFSQSIELNEESDVIEVDAELPLEYFTPEILKVIDRLEPFGKGNREINFLARSLKISDINFIGRVEAKHAKLQLDTGKYKWPALYWGAADKISEGFKVGDMVNAIFAARRNFFNGMETTQLIIIDIEGA